MFGKKKNEEVENDSLSILDSEQSTNEKPYGDKANRSRLSNLSKQKKLPALGLIVIFALTALGAATNIPGSNKSLFSLVAETLGIKEPAENSSSLARTGVNPTLQLSKEYIYAGSRMLAVEDYGISGNNPTPVPSTPSAGFVGFDTSNQGNWLGNYAAAGVFIADDATSFPSWAQFSLSGHNTHTWASSTSDQRALIKTGNHSDRIASTLYSSGTYDTSQFEMNFNFTDGQQHRLALYSVDWDNQNRQQIFELVNSTTGEILDTETISNFSNGIYVLWNVRGQFTVRVRNGGGTSLNAVVSGVFIDPPTAVTTTASFVGFDTTNQGNWSGTYAAQGIYVAGDTASLPGWLRVSVTGQNTNVWANSTTDARALIKPLNTSDRIASTFHTSGTYNTAQFEMNFSFTDGQVHQLAVYSLDWDNLNRQQTLEIVSTSTGAILDSRTISNFGNGVYTIWDVQGQFTVRVRNAGGTSLNAVVSGFFIDAP